MHDIRYSARLLARNPIFALTAALSLAIGIGANTTIFTIANALLLGPAPGVQDVDRLVDILGTQNGRSGTVGQISYPDYLDIRARATTLDGVYAYQPVPQPVSLRAMRSDLLTGSAGPISAETVGASYVSTNY